MEDKKLCPLRFHPDGDGVCIEKKCAWWDDEDEWCVIQSIANYIGHIWSMGIPPKGGPHDR